MKRSIIRVFLFLLCCSILLLSLAVVSFAEDDIPSLRVELTKTEEQNLILTVEFVNVEGEEGFFYTTLVLTLPSGYSVDTSGWTEWRRMFYIEEGDNTISYSLLEGTMPSFEFEMNTKGPIQIIIPLNGDGEGYAELSLDWAECEVNDEYYEVGFAEDSVLSVFIGSGSTTPAEIPASDITDSTGGAATVTSSIADGTATFNVASDKACVVAYTTDGGETYTRLTATASGDAYDFSVAYTEGMQFVVAVKGDADGSGTVNTADAMAIARSCLSDTHGAYVARNALNNCLYDVNGDGMVNTADAMAIARACLSDSHGAYQALTW